MSVGFAVVGLGNWGLMHLAALRSHPGVEVVAVCDADGDRAKRTAKEHGIAKAYDRIEDLLSDPDVEAVSVVTPDFAHTDVALAVIESGRHMLIEKPLATTLADCERIIAAAEKSDRRFMVDFHNRWSPIFVRAKEAIDDGRMGDPQMAYLRLNDQISVPTEMLPWAGRSTVTWFVGTHAVDTVRWLFGREVRRVYAVKRSRVLKSRGIDTPDFFQSTLELDGGGVAVVENCWILPNSTPNLIDLKCEVIGTEGAVYIDASHHRALERYTSQPEGGEYPDLFVCPKVHGQIKGFALESIRHFANCVVEGREPMVTLSDGLEVTRVILAIHESAETGRAVDLA
ncbi:MAG: Gfo/Idh/MocA family oxidoreductase [Phycisphaerae bacterium]|nr:Gfo/Idh/MocA family oxidoreductase [Phycisphaerae bacterium]